MRKRITTLSILLVSMLALSGCGEAMQGASAQTAFSITLEDGRTVQCVQATGHSGDVSIECDFASAE